MWASWSLSFAPRWRLRGLGARRLDLVCSAGRMTRRRRSGRHLDADEGRETAYATAGRRIETIDPGFGIETDAPDRDPGGTARIRTGISALVEETDPDVSPV